MTSVRNLAVFLCVLCAVVACQHEKTLVGDWEGTHLVAGIDAPLKLHFGADGVRTVVTSVIKDGQGVVATDRGTWKMDGDSLITTMTDIGWDPVTKDKDARDKAIAMFEKQKPKIIAQSNKNAVSHVTWVDADHITIVQGASAAVTLHRVGQ